MKVIAVCFMLIFVSSIADAANRKGSHRVGGYNSSGKGSHYLGGINNEKIILCFTYGYVFSFNCWADSL